MTSLLITLVVGIVVGVLANFCYQWVRQAISRFSDHIDIKGVWAESINDGTERLYSIGEIQYDLRRMMWIFDGTNYHNDGRPFCHWKTISSYVDTNAKRYYYIFLNTHDDEMHAGYTGFGFVDLARHGKTWIPRRGAFAAGNPGEAFRSHTMIRLEKYPEDQASVLEAFSRLPNNPSNQS